MKKYRLQLKLKDGQNLGYIQMDNGEPYYDYGYSEATLFEPTGVLDLLNRISLDKYDVWAEVPYTTNKGRKGKVALRNKELKTYMQNELNDKSEQFMENITQGHYYRVSFVQGKNLNERYFVCNFNGKYQLKKSEELLANSSIAVFKGTFEDLKKWLFSIRQSAKQQLEQPVIPIIEEFIDEDKLMSVFAMNTSFTTIDTKYQIPKDIEIPKATSRKYFFIGNVIELDDKSEQFMENKIMDKKTMYDDLGNARTPEEWAKGISDGTVNEAKEADEHEVNELVLYMENTQKHYNNIMAVVKNLARKMAKGNFDKELAVKGMMYPVNDAAKAYKKEFSGEGYEKYDFNPATKKAVAEELLDRYMEDIEDMAGTKNEMYDELGNHITPEEYAKGVANGTINESVEDESDDNMLALEDYFVSAEGEDPSEVEIKAGYTDNLYDTPWGEYYVFGNYEDAKQAAVEYEKQVLDDIGIDALNWNYMPYEIGHYVDRDWFQAAMEESNQFYIDDIRNESASSDEFENRLEEEMADAGVTTEEEYLEHLNNNYADPIDWYKDNFGDEEFNQVVKERGLVDLDAVAEGVVETDGPANALAGYDGEEIEWEFDGNYYYIYRAS